MTEVIFVIGLVVIFIVKITTRKKTRKKSKTLPTVTPPSGGRPTTPKWWEAHKDNWFQTYWKNDNAKVLPIVVFVIMIDYCLWILFPTKMWDPIWKSWERVLVLHAFYCIALTGLQLRPVWKTRTAMILITICVITLTTNVLKWTPAFGEKWWIDRAVAEALAEVKQQADAKAQAEAEEALPREFTVEAPVGSWSERVPTLHGEIIRPHGPILLRNDKWQVVERDDVAKKTWMTEVVQTGWVQFQSRISKPVQVTVQR